MKFTIACCTIDPLTPSFDPSPLIPYIEGLGITYHYVRTPIIERASTSGKNGGEVDSLCSFCARLKRGALYSCARENKYTKLVLAQHLDDICESFLMSVMNNGLCRTMKASYTIDDGNLGVIRPLVYCRESMCRDFSKQADLPVINENCPACFEEPKERARIKKLLSKEEALNSNIFDNMRRAMRPCMHPDFVPVTRMIDNEINEKGKKENRTRYAHDSNNKVIVGDKKWEKTTNSLRRKGGGSTSSEEKKEPLSSVSASRNEASTSFLDSFTDADLEKELERRKLKKLLNAATATKGGGGGPTCSLGGCEIFE